MAMVIVIVPPVGPPIPVIVGRALKDGTVFMDQRFKDPRVFFEDGQTKLFPNGTLVYQNGTFSEGDMFWGTMDPRNRRYYH